MHGKDFRKDLNTLIPFRPCTAIHSMNVLAEPDFAAKLRLTLRREGCNRHSVAAGPMDNLGRMIKLPSNAIPLAFHTLCAAHGECVLFEPSERHRRDS